MALALVFGVVASATALGYLSSQDESIAILATVGILVVAVVARNVAWVAIMAVAGVWIIKRAPGIDVSFTDVLVAGAGAMAWAAGVGRSLRPPARIVLRSFAIYLAALSVTLAYNHSVRSDLELFHRVALVAGAILVGAWLVRAGLHHTALRILLGITVLMSLAAVIDSIGSGLAPGQPFGYQKNFVGSIAATVLLVMLAASREFQLPAIWLRTSSVAIAAGLVASQSRGAMLAFAVGAGVWWLRQRHQSVRPGRLGVVLLFAVALTFVTVQSVRSQLDKTDADPINSLTQRFDVERATRQLWIDHPFTGVGLRYFKTPAYASYQAPNNVFNEILAEAGVLGLLGFAVFIVGGCIGLSRVGGDLAVAALCVVIGRFAHGLVDIYWTGGATTLPWLVAGMALALAQPLQGVRSDLAIERSGGLG